jgi:hypothetical protein
MRARVRGVVDGVGAASTASDAPATIDAEALLLAVSRFAIRERLSRDEATCGALRIISDANAAFGPMVNCGFAIMEQCLANVRGIGGNCTPQSVPVPPATPTTGPNRHPSDDYGLYKSSGRDIRRNSPRLTPPMMFAGGAARPIIRTSLSICCYLVHAPRIT